MTPEDVQAIVGLIDETRLLYNTFLGLLNRLHVDSDLTPSQRAVLEYLYRNGDTTVPGIARARGVTRQHIQTIVNDLLEHGLAGQRRNPSHQRSLLVTLTDSGRSAIESALERERTFIEEHLGDLDPTQVKRATQTLAHFRHLGERSAQ